MIISVSLRLMERSRQWIIFQISDFESRISDFSSGLLSLGPLAEVEQLRADPQANSPGCLFIDLEADLVVRHKKIDHAAGQKKTVRFADGQNPGAADRVENLRQPLPFRRADEKDVASLQLGQGFDLPDHEGMVIDGFVVNRALQIVTERVLAD